MGEEIIQSKDPLSDAIKKLGKHNIDNMEKLKFAKRFANSSYAFVGFEGGTSGNNYFCLRVDYDNNKKGHVNLVKNSKKYAYVGESSSWYDDIINNINSPAYCGVSKDKDDNWETRGHETNEQYIEGMKKYMKRVASVN